MRHCGSLVEEEAKALVHSPLARSAFSATIRKRKSKWIIAARSENADKKWKKQAVVDNAKGPILLAVTPTRELCYQIWEDTKKFGEPVKITATLAYGGATTDKQ